MRAWRFAARSFVRGLRAGRLTVLMIALTLAVAAITSIGFFIDRVHALDSTSSYTVASPPPAGGVWLEDGLLARLGADVGARVTIGARTRCRARGWPACSGSRRAANLARRW